MAGKTMRVRLDRIGTAAFEAVAEGSGGKVVLDGSPEIGGEGRGMRPMELMLTAIASCAAMDVVHILRKQREPLESLHIEVEGDRADATPAPFTAIRVVLVANAAVDAHKLERAVSLAVEKYCSATASLDPSISVTWEARRA
ncbi:OsmC family protein [Sandaracinus amylolyticus]|uniref:OsmC family protein n=1 Tax=Sandaracinus amylolyticus TaxID=927083 RepID=UPI001F19A925|nr:OsmC family protein [Sandaracinus amylolyticus]UJR81386.1 Osmotically inducible protein OsmC [Sandaracinus amylolyticus]